MCNVNTESPKSGAVSTEISRLSNEFRSLLLSRGIPEDRIGSFLRPSLSDLRSPFEIKDMDRAADRINRAIREKEKILIFGDYDCDGICAISILMLTLRESADVSYFIPNRNTDGYGMTVEALERVIAARRPELIITVDCGITSVAEAEFLKREGIDLIVTDHHEPQGILPDCITVDPKIEKKGFYDLCGAGVAYKLACALSGSDKAEKYLSIAAIATIADVVPLTGDNRIIARFGLEALNRSPLKGVKLLAGKDAITSRDVMFRLAPRINAAGRLGTAMKAVDLFLSDDYFILKTLAEELEADNLRRQKICESVVREASAKLRGTDFNKTKIIMLADSGWESGVLGIAAARLAEDFNRPTVLFSERDGVLKGSARSIEGINVFELLNKHSGYFLSFGGHAQAAGVSMKADLLSKLRDELDSDLGATYPDKIFKPSQRYEAELARGCDTLRLAKELELLEPTGYGNPVPVFLMRTEGLRFESVGFTPHIKCVNDTIELMGFSRFSSRRGETRGKAELLITLCAAEFQNRVYAQGIIKSIHPLGASLPDGECEAACVHQLRVGSAVRPIIETVQLRETELWLERDFGTLFVCFRASEYDTLCRNLPVAAALPLSIGCADSACPVNRVIIAPDENFDFSYYQRIVMCGSALSENYIGRIASSVGECYALPEAKVCPPYVSDDNLRAAFVALREMARSGKRAKSPDELSEALMDGLKLTPLEAAVSMAILRDLGLISVSDRGIITVYNVKTDLKRSVVYNNLRNQ